MGRMGQQLIKSSKADKNIKLTTLTESKLVKKKIVDKKPIKVIIMIGIIETLSITYSIPMGGAQFPKA